MPGGRTLVVDDDALGDFYLAVVREGVRGGRLEEEEGFARGRVVELLDVGGVVAADGDALLTGARVSVRARRGAGDGRAPFCRG